MKAQRGPPEHPADSLQAQLDLCRITLASVGEAVITTDVDGRVVYLNSVAESLTGWTLQEAAGRPLGDVFRAVDVETHQPAESPTVRALRDGVVVDLAKHTLLIARDGTERPIDDCAAPIRDRAGAIVGVVLVFRDVTVRKLAEDKVRDALAYANDIIATVREPFLVLDKTLRVQKANRSFFQTFQVSSEDTIGRFVYRLGNGQWDIPRLRTLLEDVIPENRAFDDFTVDHDFPTIGRRIMVLNGRRFESADGKLELILLAIEDVTKNRGAEVAVRTSEVRYRRLFETAKDGILILDAQTGKILEANPFMVELLGYTHDEFLGKELWEIGVFKDRAENEAAFFDLQRHGYVRYDYLPLETRDGHQVEVEFVSNVYQVENRHVAQCNIRDISDRSRLERQTKEQAAELSDLHRRKDEFLAMLSHELRNPLAPISNAVHLLRLQQGSENPIQREARNIIGRQVAQLNHLVDDLLEISRITTGRVQLRQERVTAGGIVENAVETVRPLIELRKHEFSVSVPLEPIWLYADASRLEQVVVNLLTNAAKYTPEGGRIALAVQREGEQCVIKVSDTGVGIPAELLPRIFDLFTQAERSLDRSQGGLGIGLALVQRLTELHSGTVAATSVLGQGSEFVVRLPIAAGVAPEPAPPEPISSAVRSLRLLVVDDNMDAAESFALLLLASGHKVRTAYDGPSAVEAARVYRPDVAFLDIGLPGLNGYEVARAIRLQSENEKVVLVAMTGYGQETDRKLSKEAGFDHHLVKPADFDKVKQILAAVVAKES
jgi:PAS domain S-box-containing protein